MVGGARGDGRGPDTALRDALPAHYGLADMAALIEALHLGVITEERVQEVDSPPVPGGRPGDAVAVSLVQRQADEIVALAVSAMHRLDLLDDPSTSCSAAACSRRATRCCWTRSTRDWPSAAPQANARVVDAPPVVGAALLGLDRIGASGAAQARLRSSVT